MKLLLVPMLLVLAAVAQVVRIQRVVADEPQQPPASGIRSLAEEFSIPLAERLENAKQRHAQLIAERQRHVDAAKSSNLPAAQDVSHSGPPLSQEQIDFDRLTKEFENFAGMDYVIEPPDILSIKSDKLVPKAPHRLETFDKLQIRVTGAIPEQPIDNAYNVDADGTVNLGPTYGRIAVVGQTIQEADDVIRAGLSRVLPDVDVTVTLLASSSAQAITGQHLVAMDGRVNLGFYGSVLVTGMTLKEARAAFERKLAEQFDDPKVSVKVLAYNSKVYYVITQRRGGGDEATRLPIPFPVDGRENVAEALARVYDNADRTLKLKELADASLTLVRPAPNGVGLERVYPIVWDASTQAPTPLTNHGMLPGDRIFVELKPAAALPKKAYSVKDVNGREFTIEPRFLPNVRGSRKSMPTGAEGGSEVGTNNSTPSKTHTTDKAAYRLQPYDTIKLRVARPHRPAHVLTWGDLEGEFTLSRDGSIYLGDDLELAQLAGMTSEEACTAIERQLREVAPECKATLELGPLASEKFFVSIQRPDGTEVAAGAMPVDASAPASTHLGSLRHWLGTAFEEADWELAEPADSNVRKAYLPGPGDRLVIKVRADAELGLLESPPSRPNYRVTVPPPMWIEVFGKKTRGFRIAPLPGWRALYSTQFDHPDVQRPAGPKYAR